MYGGGFFHDHCMFITQHYGNLFSDIGGGYKRRDDEKMAAKEIGFLIQQSIKDTFYLSEELPTVIAEPGA